MARVTMSGGSVATLNLLKQRWFIQRTFNELFLVCSMCSVSEGQDEDSSLKVDVKIKLNVAALSSGCRV